MKTVKTRKTVDEYHIMTDYGYGEESECVEETYRAAKEQLRCYQDNANARSVRIKKVRVKIEAKKVQS